MSDHDTKMNKLSRYAPAGLSLTNEIGIFLFGLVISILFSTGFLFRFVEARNMLYEVNSSGKLILLPGARMPEMTSLIHNAFAGFFLLCLLALAAAAYHYIFHTQGSKSIYLMRRLPDKWELHRRCLTLPCLAILISLGTALVLFLLYYGIYLWLTPKTCLPTGSLDAIRSVIL